MVRPASSSEGWTPAAGSIVNEMLLHDVYDVPYDVLRSAMRDSRGRLAAECPCCGGTGEDDDSIRHTRDCSFTGTVSHL